MPLFGDAYLADTRHLSLEEHGAYLQLMMIAWRTADCALPNDDGRLARMLGITAGRWAKMKPTIMAFWDLGEAGWTQKRLSKERSFVDKKRAQNKSSAEARWNSQDTENKGPEECDRISERNAPPPPPPIEGSEAKASSPLRGDAESRSGEDLFGAKVPAIQREPITEAVEAWNTTAVSRQWPTITTLSDIRRSHLKARLKAVGIEGWRAALTRAAASRYLGGAPPPHWFTFDWVIKQSNFQKLIEGNYDRDDAKQANANGSGASGIGRTAAAGHRALARFERPYEPSGQG